MLVIPEESEINCIVVIIGVHKQNIYSAYRCHGVYLLKKDAAGKWMGSNPDAALEYSAEVNVSHSDRIDIAVECGEDEIYRTVATREEGPLFVDVDLTRTYVNNRVATALVSGSEKNSLSFGNSKCAYIAIRSDGATALRQNVTSGSEGLKVYKLPRGSGLESENVEATARREESGIRVTWSDRKAHLWNANANWAGGDHE